MQEMMLSVVRTVWADGGQRGARRNAWAAMAADARRARQRAEAEAAMNAVVAMHELTVATIAATG
jgi:hypothetical protein